MIEQKEEEEMLDNYRKEKDAEYLAGQKQFQNRTVTDPLPLKFRLAHQTSQFEFSRKDKIETIFRYVSSCLREGFENRYNEFDLTQTFPQLSLKNKQDKLLGDVFEESEGELLIVREL